MRNLLFTWNSLKENFNDKHQRLEEFKNDDTTIIKWRTGLRKNIDIGDIGYLMKIGSSPKGIFGRGTIIKVYENHLVDLKITELIDPSDELLINFDELIEIGSSSNQNWTPQSTCTIIKNDAAERLAEILNESTKEDYKFKDSFQRYLILLESSDWAELETYKFEFSNWIEEKVDISYQNSERLLKLFSKSQKMTYSNSSSKGIQFMIKSGRNNLKGELEEGDVEIFKNISKDVHPDKAIFKERSISYTGLTCWLGTLFPNKFIPVPKTDFKIVFEHLFNTELNHVTGFKAFLQNQFYAQKLKIKVHFKLAEKYYLPLINRYRRINKFDIKSKFSEADINWVIEDFLLYIHRVELGFDDMSYLSFKENLKENEDELNLAEREKVVLNRIKRISGNPLKVKLLNNFKCQICGISSDQYKTKFLEGAHIKPLGSPHYGLDQTINMLCLCPNHHKLFDLGIITIDESMNVVGVHEKSLKLSTNHVIDQKFLSYHRNKIFRK